MMKRKLHIDMCPRMLLFLHHNHSRHECILRHFASHTQIPMVLECLDCYYLFQIHTAHMQTYHIRYSNSSPCTVAHNASLLTLVVIPRNQSSCGTYLHEGYTFLWSTEHVTKNLASYFRNTLYNT